MNNEINNNNLDNMFLIKEIDNDNNIIKDLNDFQKLNDMIFEATEEKLEYVNDEKLHKDKEQSYYNKELFTLCSKKYQKIIKMQKDKFNKFNIKRIIKMQDDKNKKQEIQKEFTKNINGTSVAIYKGSIMYEEYKCYDEVVYSNKERVYREYLINYNNGQNGVVDGYNTEYLNEKFSYSIFKSIIVLFFYLLFLVGLFFKVKSIGDSIFFGKFIILAVILSLLIIRIIPKIKAKKVKKRIKVKDSVAERDFVSKFPLMSIDTFMLDLCSKIKTIHYANNEMDVSDFVSNIDLFDIIKSYENVIECSISDVRLLNISQDSEYIKINIRCIAKLYEFNSELSEDLFINKGNNKNCNNIIIKNEEMLITVKTLKDSTKDNEFIICEYKIFK